VWWARELVDADNSLQGAMNYLFGNVFGKKNLHCTGIGTVIH
jgi:hypothetical protein